MKEKFYLLIFVALVLLSNFIVAVDVFNIGKKGELLEYDVDLLKNTLLVGEWVCIAQTCVDWAYGDDWVTNNCRPQTNGNVTELVCSVVMNDKTYNAPLSILNISTLRSCNEYKCVTEVFVKTSINGGS